MTTTMTMITRDALHSTVGISFWGGIDPHTGHIIDPTHPLHGECISNKILCIPSGRGSCTGSQVMLELILSGLAPHAILTRDRDAILVAGAMVAEEFFGDELGPGAVPIFAAVGDADFARLVGRRTLSIARLDDDGGGGGGGGRGRCASGVATMTAMAATSRYSRGICSGWRARSSPPNATTSLHRRGIIRPLRRNEWHAGRWVASHRYTPRRISYPYRPRTSMRSRTSDGGGCDSLGNSSNSGGG